MTYSQVLKNRERRAAYDKFFLNIPLSFRPHMLDDLLESGWEC